MKELKQYQCEYCHTLYTENLKCNKCESNHVQPIKIIQCHYHPFNVDKSGEPCSVFIEMSNGKTVRYKKIGKGE